MTFWPSFHWPRFFKSSTRSKRFSTLRLAAIVLAPFKLRCCDIDYLVETLKTKMVRKLQRKASGDIKPTQQFFKKWADLL